MSGSLREIDITVPARRLLPLPRRYSMPSEVAEVPDPRERTDKPAFRTTESLASGKGVALPRFMHALDVYQQNMDAQRTLLAGPLFIDTYA
jgi:hypothetical protein